MTALNLRSAHRAVAGGGPGPEGNITKLLLSENGHEVAAILAALAGPDLAFLDGPGAIAGTLVLLNRSMSIAGRHVGDQAQPDRRADPRPAPRSPDPLGRTPVLSRNGHAGRLSCPAAARRSPTICSVTPGSRS